jgi:NTE family protein
MKRNILLSILVVFIFAVSSCATMSPTSKTAKIALVLGAGSSKGFAHIGVLKVLEMNHIPINMIVGTSVGSAVGSLYAYGYDAFQLQRISFSVGKGDIVDFIIPLPINGFIRGEKLEEFINKTLNNTPMEKLKIPFYAVATDIQNGQEVVFGSGNTGQAVRASCSIPGIFRPVQIGDRMYVDGGVVSPIAVDAARRLGADIVIAVDISGGIDRTKPESTMATIFQTFNIMYAKLSDIQLARADVVIRPKVDYIGSSDFSKRNEAILEGEKAAMEVLPQITQIINRLKKKGRLESK